jgi:hypothetical protein
VVSISRLALMTQPGGWLCQANGVLLTEVPAENVIKSSTKPYYGGLFWFFNANVFRS